MLPTTSELTQKLVNCVLFPSGGDEDEAMSFGSLKFQAPKDPTRRPPPVRNSSS